MNRIVKITCKNCGEEYSKGGHWQCFCGQIVEAFDVLSDGCSQCGWSWTSIQCPNCASNLTREEWLGAVTNEKIERGLNILKPSYHKNDENVTK